ncbi:MAG: hypothetical protein GY903_19305 [Fuerstiella sp.]|nr:hypothetical protein [Fuerstiella sp.]MCP4856633.1 hypothetical protein [Fuerstiella sp.]
MLVSRTTFAADIRSGLQVGAFPGAFNVADVTGPSAGEKLCYRCRYGARPVVSIFTRKLDNNVAKLIKEVDAVVGKNRDSRMAAFVVLLTDDPDAHQATLKKAADTHGIKHTPLTVFENSDGPGKYRINKDADVTVLMWVENDVKVNHAYTAGDLNSDAIAKIVGDTKKILN